MGKGHHRKGNIAVILLAGVVLPLLLSLLPGCGREDSPQKEIEKFVAAGKEAAEARKAGDLRELISAGYADGHGRTRRDVAALAARYLYANKNIHLFTRIDELVFSGPDAARLRLSVCGHGGAERFRPGCAAEHAGRLLPLRLRTGAGGRRLEGCPGRLATGGAGRFPVD